MYEQYYGLSLPPFELTTSPKALFLSGGQREALSNLEYGLSTSKAITLVVGEAGTGKTTLVRAAMASEHCQHVQCLYLHNPALTRAEFLEALARQFQLSRAAAQSKTTLLCELEETLTARCARNEAVALVIDEAQSLTHEVLEEIRLLANLECGDRKLVPLVLAGQPELAQRLNDPSLRQLKQRVALRCLLEPLTLSETGAYIAHRIRSAGGEAARLFTREAVVLIHQQAGGLPRLVNVICDNALLSGMALGRQPVGRDVVAEVCRDFDFDAGHRVERYARENGARGDSPAVRPYATRVEREDLASGADAPADGEIAVGSRAMGSSDER
ncbi:MAG: ExeA family protein [Vicinamibacterales bacterium]